MPISSPSLQKSALEFKSTSLTVPVLVLSSNDLLQIQLQLQEKIAQAPEFFKNSPILLDLKKLNMLELGISVQEVVNLIRELQFLPIGIRGGSDQQNHDALAISLPVHAMNGTNAPINDRPSSKTLVVTEAPEVEQPEQILENKIITQPVRSGQRVYAKGDLIVTATVSAGSEIMAEGNIHVYGTLRGRALAGILGNTESRIFCSDLQAELISIAGIYQLSDDINFEFAHKPVQISLDNQTLIIKDI